MRKSNFIGAVAVVALATIGLTGCSGRDGDTGGGSAAACSPGVTDTQVKLGMTLPQSGAAAAYGTIGTVAKAYFDRLNKSGGVKMEDGKTRKIALTVLDDGYDPARSVQNAHELIDQDKVFALAGSLGVSGNVAIMPYVNQQKVPAVFGLMGGTDIDTPTNKWLTAGSSEDRANAQIWAKFVKERYPNAKVAILYQNDDFGRQVLDTFNAGVKGSSVKVVASQSYEPSATSTASQVVNLATSGADLFLDYASAGRVTESLQKAYDLDWHPVVIISNGNSFESLLTPLPAGALATAYSAHWLKTTAPEAFAGDPGLKSYTSLASEAGFDPNDGTAGNGYQVAQMVQQSLEAAKGCTRQDFIDAVKSLTGTTDLLMTGLKMTEIKGSLTPIHEQKLMKWNGKAWDVTGDIVVGG